MPVFNFSIDTGAILTKTVKVLGTVAGCVGAAVAVASVAIAATPTKNVLGQTVK